MASAARERLIGHLPAALLGRFRKAREHFLATAPEVEHWRDLEGRLASLRAHRNRVDAQARLADDSVRRELSAARDPRGEERRRDELLSEVDAMDRRGRAMEGLIAGARQAAAAALGRRMEAEREAVRSEAARAFAELEAALQPAAARLPELFVQQHVLLLTKNPEAFVEPCRQLPD